MICCILALLIAGPLGILLAPIWEPRRDVLQADTSCCRSRQALWRAGTILLAVLLLAALFTLALHFLDPPAYRRFCTFPVFR